MRNLSRGVAALCALFLIGTGPALAANAPTYPDQNGIARPAQGVVCINPTSGDFESCAGAGGGGGGGAVTVADGANVTQGALADAATSAGATGSISAKLRLMTTQLNAIQTSVASTATNTAAATPAGTALIGNVGGPETAGSAVTGGGTRAMGKDASGAARDIRTDDYGGLIGGGMTPASTRTTLTASASTALPGAASTTRPSYLTITIETALAADLFICLNNQTCSATVYDELLPTTTTTKGFRRFVEIPFTSAVTYFTTGTPVVNVTRWSN